MGNTKGAKYFTNQTVNAEVLNIEITRILIQKGTSEYYSASITQFLSERNQTLLDNSAIVH